ncbi:cysteine--tRNA ligase [Pseudoclavibacter chungangensis]|uniref:Cysteine--tRNA ligase n=1 Tax=Pseudoclavibacter chungangensis TaxID=587635 RepID=A0A7J5C1P8_9MICO|nr:cysteine--tRNA ligase [Pseudoclavibacter chungangensis]KAB1660355.1 cysteine--tRNA ligase [Pseudoclavibacter chungangensis]NYJ65714.1 cysteinyl-tRNA synthetase [Pseudoclavibacter chungangensis]
MNQRLYDSKTRTLRDFVPLRAGEVSMYVCGPTVQSGPHIGHLRSALVYDQMRRWFEYDGARVTLVRNVTDIDDKTLANATPDEPWWALAYRVEREFTAAYARIGVRPPTYEPRATASIMEMQAIIERLVERGHAYPADDGSGDVYFDTASWPAYGELTHQRADEMEPATDSVSRAKRDPRDFALWKGRKDGEPDSAAWPSPWGEGRPGWHIECSAMSTKYLGPAFDIHGGGLDLRFPHHENELAQSTAAGDPFASYWLHNGLIHFSGQKMSKSIGNIVSVDELFAAARPVVVRYVLGAAHYRSTIDFSPTTLEEADAAFARIEAFVARSASAVERVDAPAADSARVPDAFAEAMRDDFAMPQALAVLHGEVTLGNQALDANDDAGAVRARSAVLAMLGVLGLDPGAPEWSADDDHASAARDRALDALVGGLVARRAEARATRDFAEADRLRDLLADAGVQIADTPHGTDWNVE